ncbi:unnamed protein product, partial [Rotaria sordida]
KKIRIAAISTIHYCALKNNNILNNEQIRHIQNLFREDTDTEFKMCIRNLLDSIGDSREIGHVAIFDDCLKHLEEITEDDNSIEYIYRQSLDERRFQQLFHKKSINRIIYLLESPILTEKTKIMIYMIINNYLERSYTKGLRDVHFQIYFNLINNSKSSEDLKVEALKSKKVKINDQSIECLVEALHSNDKQTCILSAKSLYIAAETHMFNDEILIKLQEHIDNKIRDVSVYSTVIYSQGLAKLSSASRPILTSHIEFLPEIFVYGDLKLGDKIIETKNYFQRNPDTQKNYDRDQIFDNEFISRLQIALIDTLETDNQEVIRKAVRGFQTLISIHSAELSKEYVEALLNLATKDICDESIRQQIHMVLNSSTLDNSQKSVLKLCSLQYESNDQLLDQLGEFDQPKLLKKHFHRINLILDHFPDLNSKALEILLKCSNKEEIPDEVFNSINGLLLSTSSKHIKLLCYQIIVETGNFDNGILSNIIDQDDEYESTINSILENPSTSKEIRDRIDLFLKNMSSANDQEFINKIREKLRKGTQLSNQLIEQVLSIQTQPKIEQQLIDIYALILIQNPDYCTRNESIVDHLEKSILSQRISHNILNAYKEIIKETKCQTNNFKNVINLFIEILTKKDEYVQLHLDILICIALASETTMISNLEPLENNLFHDNEIIRHWSFRGLRAAYERNLKSVKFEEWCDNIVHKLKENLSVEVNFDLELFETTTILKYISFAQICDKSQDQWIRELLIFDLIKRFPIIQVKYFDFYKTWLEIEEEKVFSKDESNVLLKLLHRTLVHNKILFNHCLQMIQILKKIDFKNAFSILSNSRNPFRDLHKIYLTIIIKQRLVNEKDISDKYVNVLASNMINKFELNINEKLLGAIKNLDNLREFEEILNFAEENHIKESDIYVKDKTVSILKRSLELKFLGNQIKEIDRLRLATSVDSLLNNHWTFEQLNEILNVCKLSNSRKKDQCFLDVLVILSQYKLMPTLENQKKILLILEKPIEKWIPEINKFAIECNFTKIGRIKNAVELIKELKNSNSRNTEILELADNYFLSSIEKIKSSHLTSDILYQISQDSPKYIAQWNSNQIRHWAEAVKNKVKIHSFIWTHTVDFVIEACAVTKRANYLCTKFHLTDTQILSCLVALLRTNMDKGKLLQVATGEGKSIVISILAVIYALRDNTVDIITSTPVLAERDSIERRAFYNMFGFECSNNNDKLIYSTGSKACYKKQIVYGEVAQFQFDMLRTEYAQLNTLAGRQCQVALVDEVDSMLIDDSSKIAKLATTIPGMDQLQIIYHFFWHQLITFRDKIHIIDDKMYLLNGKVGFEEQVMFLEYCDGKGGTIKIPNIKEYIASSTDISHIGKLISEDDQFNTVLKEHLNSNFETSIRKNINTPKHFQSFINRQLPKWIDNAITAFHYEENVHYVVHEGLIKPVDFDSTGIVQSSSFWSDGLHQFLQIKHNLKMTSETFTTNFLSNKAYFTRYGPNLFGLTGTLGSEKAKDVLTEVYAVDLAIIPSLREKQYLSLPDIVATNEVDWLNKICDCALIELNKGRGTLIICETIENCEILVERLRQKCNPSAIKLYTMNNINQEKNVEIIKSGEIIVATNLAGRGTDIKTDEIEQYGGLHVILTFMPPNKRVEDQAFGRTARQGIDLVINDSLINSKYDQAMKHFDEAIKLDPDHSAAAFFGKGWLLLKGREDFFRSNQQELSYKEAAVKLFHKALQILSKEMSQIISIQTLLQIRFSNMNTDLSKQLFQKAYILEISGKASITDSMRNRGILKQTILHDGLEKGSGQFCDIRLISDSHTGNHEDAIKKIKEIVIIKRNEDQFMIIYKRKDVSELDQWTVDDQELKNNLLPLNYDGTILDRVSHPNIYTLIYKKVKSLNSFYRRDFVTSLKNLKHDAEYQITFNGLTNRKDLSNIDQAIKTIDCAASTIGHNSSLSGCYKDIEVAMTRINARILKEFLNPNIEIEDVTKDEALSQLKVNSSFLHRHLLPERLSPDSCQVDLEIIFNNKESQNECNKSVREAIDIIEKQAEPNLHYNLTFKSANKIYKILKDEILPNSDINIEFIEMSGENIKEKIVDIKSRSISLEIFDVKDKLIEVIHILEETSIELNPNEDQEQNCIWETANKNTAEEIIQNMTMSVSTIKLLNLNENIVRKIIHICPEAKYNITFISIQFPDLLKGLKDEMVGIYFGKLKQDVAKTLIQQIRRQNLDINLTFKSLTEQQTRKIIETAPIEQENIEINKIKTLSEFFMNEYRPDLELSEFSARGIEYLPEFSEKRFIPWRSIAVVIAIAAVQMTVGGILIGTGFGAPLGLGLITEGGADLFTAYRAYSKRQFSWLDYGKQKAVSLIISLISMGISSINNAGKGIQNVVQGVGQEVLEQAGTKVITDGKTVGQILVQSGNNLKSLALKQIGVTIGENILKESLCKVANITSNFTLEQFKPHISASIQRKVSSKFSESNLWTLVRKMYTIDSLNKDQKFKEKINQIVIEILNRKSFFRKQWESIGDPLCRGILSNANRVNNPAGMGIRILGTLNGIYQITVIIDNAHKQLFEKLSQIDQDILSMENILHRYCEVEKKYINPMMNIFQKQRISGLGAELDDPNFATKIEHADFTRFEQYENKVIGFLTSLHRNMSKVEFNEFSQIMKLVSDIITEQILGIIESQLVLPWSSYGMGQLTKVTSEIVQHHIIVDEKQNSNSQNKENQEKGDNGYNTIKKQIDYNARDYTIAYSLCEIIHYCQQKDTIYSGPIDQNTKDYAENVRKDQPVNMSDMMALNAELDLNMKIVNDVNYQPTVDDKVNGTHIVVYNGEHFQHMSNDGTIIEIENEGRNDGYAIIKHILHGRNIDKSIQDLRNDRAKIIENNPQQFLRVLNSQQWIEAHYPCQANTLLMKCSNPYKTIAQLPAPVDTGNQGAGIIIGTVTAGLDAATGNHIINAAVAGSVAVGHKIDAQLKRFYSFIGAIIANIKLIIKVIRWIIANIKLIIKVIRWIIANIKLIIKVIRRIIAIVRFIPQRKWSPMKQECYAFICALDKWHNYLSEITFIWEIDHKSLTQLNQKPQINK